MVSLNTGSIPETVFESELFGHVAGAFTDAKSDRLGRFKLADQGMWDWMKQYSDNKANVTPDQLMSPGPLGVP